VEAARLARVEDRLACAELLGRVLADSHSMRGGVALVGPTTPDDLLERWMAPDAPTAVFVGEFHQATVGILAVSTFSRPGAPSLSGRVECCYVEEAARGVGVGTALMDAAVGWCAGRSCHDVDALALPGDRLTKQRLEAAGFTARLLTLNRRLD
jgi:GNAT superfamily N-acetyltransferase